MTINQSISIDATHCRGEGHTNGLWLFLFEELEYVVIFRLYPAVEQHGAQLDLGPYAEHCRFHKFSTFA